MHFEPLIAFNSGAIKLKRSSKSAEESEEGPGMRVSAAALNSKLAIGKFPERPPPANRDSSGLGNSTRSLQNPCAERGVGAPCCEESLDEVSALNKNDASTFESGRSTNIS